MNGLILPHNGIYTPPEALLIGGVMRGTAYSRRAVISGGGGGLQDDVASTCFVLEASNSSSYSGSGQTWSNVIASPADGAAQSDYDLYRGNGSGSSTDDPAFTGTAGVAGAYWLFDGGDFFISTQGSDVSPGFLAKMQRTDSTGFWLAFALRYDSAATNRLFANTTSAAEYGMQFSISASGILQNGRYRNSTVQTTTIAGSGAFVDNNDYLVIVSMNAARTNFRWWKNTRTASNTAPGSAWTAVTTDASRRHGIGSNYPTNSAFTPNTARLYGLAGGNDYIDDTAAGYIFDYFNTSTGITFA